MLRSSGLSLLGLLPALSTAAGKFIAALKHDVQNLRLACKELRGFIDSNVHHIKISVNPKHLRLWSDKRLPSLGRYVSLKSLELNLFAPEDEYNEQMLESLFSLPFVGLELTARQRITYLKLWVYPDWDLDGMDERPTCSIEGIMPHVVSYLPYLRNLNLMEIEDMSYTPLLQQRMYDALASLPYLEELTLPSPPALERIGTLGRSDYLTYLSISTNDVEPQKITVEALKGIVQLRQLKELNLTEGCIEVQPDSNGIMGAEFREFIDNLPPSLRDLRVQLSLQTSNIYASIDLVDGRLNDIWLSSCYDIRVLNTLAEVLLASRGLAQPHQLTSFRIREFCGMEPLVGPEMALLRQLLLERCDKVYLGKLALKVPQMAVVQVLELFGKPETLTILLKNDCKLKLRGPGQPPSWGPDVQHTSTPPQPQAYVVPLARDLAGRAINRLLRKSTAVSLQGSVDGIENEATEVSQHSLLLLRGDLVTSLARLPKALDSTMQGLGVRATEAAGDGGKCLLVYQVLPALTGAVLLLCSPAVGASEAVAAAARSVVEGLTPGLLEVQPVAPMKGLKCKPYHLAQHYHQALELELQGIWDSRGDMGGAMERELIQQMLDRALVTMPEYVSL